TKCYHNAAVLARLSSPAALIPIQNGFDPALDARGHALAGIASFVSACHPHHSHTRITRAVRLHVGYRPPTAIHPAIDPADLHRQTADLGVEPVPEILRYKYTKLMYNAANSPLAAVAGLDNGQLLAVPKARRLFFALLRENYAILKGAGVSLGKI